MGDLPFYYHLLHFEVLQETVEIWQTERQYTLQSMEKETALLNDS